MLEVIWESWTCARCDWQPFSLGRDAAREEVAEHLREIHGDFVMVERPDVATGSSASNGQTTKATPDSSLSVIKEAKRLRRCEIHGVIPGCRYCPECASSGRPWSEDQADLATARAEVRALLAVIEQQGQQVQRQAGFASQYYEMFKQCELDLSEAESRLREAETNLNEATKAWDAENEKRHDAEERAEQAEIRAREAARSALLEAAAATGEIVRFTAYVSDVQKWLRARADALFGTPEDPQ